MIQEPQSWFVVDCIARVQEAAAWEASIWVCHPSVSHTDDGRHEALIAVVDNFFRDRPEAAAIIRRVRWPVAVAGEMHACAKALIGSSLPAASAIALLAIGRGELLDKIVDYTAALQCADAFLPAFTEYVAGNQKGKTRAASSPQQRRPEPQRATSAPIDIAKMVRMGKDLLGKHQPDYADKFFVKALGVLDAFPESDRDDNIGGSIAVVLSWLVVCRTVRGRPGDAMAFGERLRRDYSFFVEQPLSDAARGAALSQLLSAFPFTWHEAECSAHALRALLSERPDDWDARAKLALTAFLAGDLEVCLTEALKLTVAKGTTERVRGMGEAIVAGVTIFAGAEHPLIRGLGTARQQHS